MGNDPEVKRTYHARRYYDDPDYREKCKINAENWRRANPEKARQHRRNWINKNRLEMKLVRVLGITIAEARERLGKKK